MDDDKRGTADELHQLDHGDRPTLTTNQGTPVSDNQNSLRANSVGPTLLEDFALREKITHFDHERIPERIVHARGTGVHGFFELTESLEQYTTARVLTEVGERTPVFARFSTVAVRITLYARGLHRRGQDPPMDREPRSASRRDPERRAEARRRRARRAVDAAAAS